MLSRTWFIFKKPETWGENKPVISSLLKWLGWVQRLTWVLQGINSPAWTLVGGEGEVRPALLEFFPESTRLLYPWDFPGKSVAVDCHFLLQGIFPTQRFNLLLFRLLLGRQMSLPGSLRQELLLARDHDDCVEFGQ